MPGIGGQRRGLDPPPDGQLVPGDRLAAEDAALAALPRAVGLSVVFVCEAADEVPSSCITAQLRAPRTPEATVITPSLRPPCLDVLTMTLGAVKPLTNCLQTLRTARSSTSSCRSEQPFPQVASK